MDITINTSSTPPPPPITSTTYKPDWVTFIHGSKNGWVKDIETDADNNIYVSGFTVKEIFTDILSPNSYLTYAGNWDAFVAKFNPDRGVEWWAYFGGSANDEGYHIVLDPYVNPNNNNRFVYLCGITASADIAAYSPNTQKPVTPSNTALSGGRDFFVARILNSGANAGGIASNIPGTFWSYFGSPGIEKYLAEVVAEPGGALWLAGEYYANGPVPPYKFKNGAYAFNGGTSFVGRLPPVFVSSNVNALGLDWSSGIEGCTNARDMVRMGTDVYFLGSTNSGSHGTVYSAATQPYVGAGNAAGSANSGGLLRLVDPSTAASEYIQPKAGTATTLDYVLLRFNQNSAITWSTMFGGAGNEDIGQNGLGCVAQEPSGRLAVDGNNKLYVAGNTATATSGAYPNFPYKAIAGTGKYNNPTYAGGQCDAFIARFSNACALEWSTYIGTTHSDHILGLSVNGSSRLHLMANIDNEYYVQQYTPTPTGWPLKNRTGHFYQNTLAPQLGNPVSQYHRGGAVTQFQLDGTLYYSTYYGEMDFSVSNITNRSSGAQFYFGGVGQQYSVSILQDLPGNADYFSNAKPEGCGYAVVGQFSTYCQGCQRESLPAAQGQVAAHPDLIRVFPNPVSDYVSVALDGDSQIVSVRWMDVTGRELAKFPLPAGPGEYQLQTSGLPDGILILELTTPNGLASHKVVKHSK